MADSALMLPALTQSSLMRLPNELLLTIGGLLDLRSMARLMGTSRFFYQMLVPTLYRRGELAKEEEDDDSDGSCCCSSALRWGCRTSNVDTLRRAVAAGANPAQCWPHAFAMALDSRTPLTTLAFLLDHGGPTNIQVGDDDNNNRATFWPILTYILEAAVLPPRWCPVPIIKRFLAHGATLDTDASILPLASVVWDKVQALVQVRGPRQWRWTHGGTNDSHCDNTRDLVLRHDHCQHDTEPCNVALTRLLLQQGRADPNIVFSSVGDDEERERGGDGNEDSLLSRALDDPRRSVELLRCLASAGADLGRLCKTGGKVRGEWTPPLLHAVLEDAVRLRSLAAYPRRRFWDCYPGVRYFKAEEIVRFLLARGLPLDTGGGGGGDSDRNGDRGRNMARSGGGGHGRTLWLLERWDRRWQRFYRKAGMTGKAEKAENSGMTRRETREMIGKPETRGDSVSVIAGISAG